MTIRLTSAQRCVLADCTRTALVGWLITDPAVGSTVCRLQARSTTVCGFSFSRFVTQAMVHLGADYRPRSPISTAHFPLTITEAAALANDVELEMATDTQIMAAALIVSHSPYGAPEVCSRDWRTYITMLAAIGLSLDDDCPDWRADVRDRLRAFRQAVATALVPAE